MSLSFWMDFGIMGHDGLGYGYIPGWNLRADFQETRLRVDDDRNFDMITDDTKPLRCATGVIVSRPARDTSVLSQSTLTNFESGNLRVGDR